MKKRKTSFIIASLLLLFSTLVNISSCAVNVQATDLMDGVTPREVAFARELDSYNPSVTDFAVRLFKYSNESGESTLISPLSVLCALSMTANGANGETLRQMESVLGMGTEELNVYLYTYMNSLPHGDYYKLNLANSIWFKDDEAFIVNGDFLQTNADYFGAELYKTPFDNKTLRDINNWVKNETDKMIPKIIDKISPDTVMYLINALAFEAEWIKTYEKSEVRDSVFTKEDGSKKSVELMYSTEGKYIEDENATGFIKYYKGSKYAFVAILPKENVTIADYINTLDGYALHELLSNTKASSVETAIPKFETEYEVEMSEILKDMGMTDAFDAVYADLSGIGSYAGQTLYIDEVIHKTYIQIAEKGTKAGAATAVGINKATAALPSEEIKRVILDRPFVYMLIDCENNVPFFIGTLMDVD